MWLEIMSSRTLGYYLEKNTNNDDLWSKLFWNNKLLLSSTGSLPPKIWGISVGNMFSFVMSTKVRLNILMFCMLGSVSTDGVQIRCENVEMKELFQYFQVALLTFCQRLTLVILINTGGDKIFPLTSKKRPSLERFYKRTSLSCLKCHSFWDR